MDITWAERQITNPVASLRPSYFNLVPQVDRIPYLVRFVQRPLGKVLALATFMTLYSFFYPAFCLPVGIALTAFAFFPRRRAVVLVFGNVFFFLTSGQIFRHLRYNAVEASEWNVLRSLTFHQNVTVAADGLNNWTLKFLVFGALFGFFYIFIKAARRYRFVADHPLAVYCGIYFTLLALASNFQSCSWFCVFAWALLNWIALSTLPVAYTAADQRLIRQKSIFLQIGTFINFWHNGNWANPGIVPRGYRGIENTSMQDSEQFATCQLSAIKLLFWSLLLHILAGFIAIGLFNHGSRFFAANQWPTLGLTHFQDVGVTRYTMLPIPWYERWITLLGTCLIFLVSLAAYSSCLVSLVKMAGFRIFRQVYRPHQSVHFNDFLQRIYFYYIDTVMKFFFYSSWRHLRFLNGSKRVRIFATAFLSILSSGFLYNFVREFPDVVVHGILGAIKLSLARSPYFIMLALCVGISSLRNRKKRDHELGWTQKVLKSALYFTVYAFCWSLQIGLRSDSLYDRFAFTLALFGIKS